MRIIDVRLSTTGINEAIRELQNYKQWLLTKTQEFLNALAEEGMKIAQFGFENAVYDGTNDVSCEVRPIDDHHVAVVAVGSATLFIEFGTGVFYPDTHPESGKNGMVRGKYGYGLGKLRNGWRYTGDPGTNGEIILEGSHAGEVKTLGNPANMSMYMAERDLEEKFEEIARRIFVDG